MTRIHVLVRKTNKAISGIIVDLGELYHTSAIVSYVYDRNQPTKFSEASYEIITERANKIKKRVVALKSSFSSYGQELNINDVVDAINEVLLTAEKIKTLDDLKKFVIPGNRLMESTEKLCYKLQRLITNISTLIENIVPVDFSHLFSNISYDDIKRHPQASVQSAFSHFESVLRNRIGALPELYGEALINAAYANNGMLEFGETTAEQLGTRNFISGAYATLRNPRMHRIVADDAEKALNIIFVVDMMIKIVEESKKK